MSTHMLKSLTNREYDDYVNQRLSRLEQQADLFRSFLATTEDPIMIDDNNSRSLNNNNQRPFRRSNSSSQHNNERASLPIRRRPSANDNNSRRRRRMPSHENLPYLYHEQNDPWHNNQGVSSQQYPPPRFRRRPRSFTMGTADSYSSTGYYHSDNDEDEEDDDSVMRRRALLTEHNTIRNANAGRLPNNMQQPNDTPIKPILQHRPAETTNPIRYNTHSAPPLQSQQPPPATTTTTTAAATTTTSSPNAPNNDIQQTTLSVQPQPQAGLVEDPVESNTTTPTMSSGTTASSSTTTGTASPLKKKSRGFWSLLFNSSKHRDQPRDYTPSPNPSMSTPVDSTTKANSSGGGRGTIRSITTTNGAVGDVLNQQQQDEIVQQLPKSITTSPNNNNIMKVADLDRIWVFRATEQNTTSANVWITFDYKNQEILNNYVQHLQQAKYQFDHGIDLFDSHIRQGQLPVLVLPTRQQAFYPTSLSGDHIVSLQVYCLPNSSELQFVYRQHQQLH